MKHHYGMKVSRRGFIGSVGGITLGMALNLKGHTAESPPVLRAGIAHVDITPPLGVSLAGHFHDRAAQGIHDPLFVKCLALDNGHHRVALGIVDNCLIPREVFDAAKSALTASIGLPPGHSMLAATHTHSGPTVAPIFQSEPVAGYADLLVEAIRQGVSDAFARLEPVQFAWGQAVVAEEVYNRRWYMKPGSIPANPFGEASDKVKTNPPVADKNLIEPAGPTDPTIPFIALRRRDGTPLAVLANYALHYVGDTEPSVISADYFGYFATALERHLVSSSAPFLAMLSNGASGNINNINFLRGNPSGKPYERMQSVGEKVAAAVAEHYQRAAFSDWIPLAVASREVELGVRKPSDADKQRAREQVGEAPKPPLKTPEQIYARETLLLAEYPDTVSVPLQALRIGPVGIAAMACEVFVEIGLALKASSPFALTMPIELANGYYGYLPTAEHHALGGYETWRARSSYLMPDSAAKVQAVMVELLREVHAQGLGLDA